MPLTEDLLSRLERIAAVRRDEPMARHTTFSIGGPADAYVKVQDCGQLKAVALLAHEWETPLLVLGAGSNLLVSDAGIPGLVVETWANVDLPPKAMPQPRPGEPARWQLQAFAGTPLPRLALQLAHAGFSGLEWAAGIPGTVGGGVVNNAGAHGGAMADVVAEVLALQDGEERLLSQCQLDYGYRTSRFRTKSSGDAACVLSTTLLVQQDSPEACLARVAEHTAYRKATQPSQRSVGSIFKNPSEHAAGWLIEQVGLKGHRIGDAQISSKHANFIVNRGKASAAEVETLVARAQDQVRRQFGIELELEIQRVGGQS